MKRVLLLKDADNAVSRGTDERRGTVETFADFGLAVDFFPVLSFRTVNKAALRETLWQPHKFSGVAVTSKRAWSSVAEMFAEICRNEMSHAHLTHPLAQVNPPLFPLDEWKAKPVYVNARKTAEAMKKELDRLPFSWDMLKCPGGLDTAGSRGNHNSPRSAGDAETLGKFILETHPDFQTNTTTPKPLLFLSVTEAMQTLPRVLGPERLIPLSVYETIPKDKLDFENLQTELSQALTMSNAVVFYSPSGVHCVFRVIPDFKHIIDNRHIILCAIGQTTKKALENSFQCGDDVSILVPNRPDSSLDLAQLISTNLPLS